MNYFCAMTCLSASWLCSHLRSGSAYMTQIRHLPNPLQSATASSPAVIKAVAKLCRSLAACTSGQCRNLDEGTLEASSLLGRSQPGFTGRPTFERGLIKNGSAPRMLAPHLFLFDSKPLTLWYQQLWPITVFQAGGNKLSNISVIT